MTLRLIDRQAECEPSDQIRTPGNVLWVGDKRMVVRVAQEAGLRPPPREDRGAVDCWWPARPYPACGRRCRHCRTLRASVCAHPGHVSRGGTCLSSSCDFFSCPSESPTLVVPSLARGAALASRALQWGQVHAGDTPPGRAATGLGPRAPRGLDRPTLGAAGRRRVVAAPRFHDNASAHLPPEADATEERTLYAVRCSALLALLAPRPVVIPHAPPDAPLPAWIVVGCMP